VILHEQQQVPIAEADWNDDGTVTLTTFPNGQEHTTTMQAGTARDLASQLIAAATDAERAADDVNRQRVARLFPHAFDTDGTDEA